MKRIRYSKKDFAWISWKEKDIRRIGEELLNIKKGKHALIKAIPATERTFTNTILALAKSDDSIADHMGRLELLENASPDKRIRSLAGEIKESLSKQLLDIEYDPSMYRAVKEYTSKKEKLAGAEALLCRDIERGYDRMGFTLSPKKRSEYIANLKKLEKLGTAFDRNLNEYTDRIVVTKEELDGLPESYIGTLKRTKEKKYIVTLAYPDSIPFMTGAHNEAKRKELKEKLMRKGGKKNLVILEKMIHLRDRNAKLLGYATHADFQTELRMAKSAARVRSFLDAIAKKTKKAAELDKQALLACKKKLTGKSKVTLGAHDIDYLFKQLRQERFNLDSDYIKEHFPFEHVKEVTLQTYQQVLGVVFRRRADIILWHPDVQFYDVFDRSGDYLSSFALDLYPREGKYGHAAVFTLVSGRKEGDVYVPPLAAMLTNFTKPTTQNPSLLTHGEVETFFHEFGHVVHNVLTKAEYHAQSGTNVAWDFVEAPSQMLENWVWDPTMLRRLSKHYQTGKPLSPVLIQKIIESRSFGEAWAVRRQVMLALLDQELHTKKVRNPNTVYARVNTALGGAAVSKGQMFIAGFGHLAHGYDAGYYGYLWSRVYAEDMFTRFEKEGVLNAKVGKDYRTWILEKGSSMEEADLIKGFLKRVPNNKAFLKSIGI